MELDEIISKLKKIISEVEEDRTLALNLTNDADLINEVGLDSIEMIDFMLQIEEELSVELNFDTINFTDLKSIESLAQFLSEQKEIQN